LLVWSVVDDLPVGALPIKQRLRVSVKQNGSYPANDDYVSMARQQFLYDAINASECVFKDHGAITRQSGPFGPTKSVCALESAATCKLIGKA
jgi:hypothetical protein